MKVFGIKKKIEPVGRDPNGGSRPRTDWEPSVHGATVLFDEELKGSFNPSEIPRAN